MCFLVRASLHMEGFASAWNLRLTSLILVWAQMALSPHEWYDLLWNEPVRSLYHVYIWYVYICNIHRSIYSTYNFKQFSLNNSLNKSEVTQLCPTLCNPVDCSLPGSSVHGIFQAIVLEWIVISFSRGSSRPKDRTQVSCIVDRRFTAWATREVLKQF